MRIVIDARMYGLENTGIGRYTIGLIEGLKRIKTNNKYLVLLRKKYFNQLNFPSNWKKILVDIDHYSYSEQIKLPKLLYRLKPDLVHFLHFNVPLLYRDHFIVTIHDLLMHRQKGVKATTLPAPLYFAKRFAYKIVFDHAIKNSLQIIVPSKNVKKEIISYYKVPGNKIKIVHEGADIPMIKKGKMTLEKYGLDGKNYFIYVGNAYPHKNLHRAIKAIFLLNKSLTRRYLLAIVCARNIFIKRLEKDLKSLKARKFVKLLGFVPDEELGCLYHNSLAMIFPSLSEGFGLPGLEAILSGTIVCLSDIPVFKEVYAGNALYFDPYNITDIKNSLLKVIKMSRIERKNLIRKSQEFTKKYNWDTMSRETLKIYGQIIK